MKRAGIHSCAPPQTVLAATKVVLAGREDRLLGRPDRVTMLISVGAVCMCVMLCELAVLLHTPATDFDELVLLNVM